MSEASEQVAIVTGGAQGIGKGIVAYLLGKGARTVIADCDREAGKECAAEMGAPERVLFVETDVSDEASAASCVEETAARFGGITALVNNAGIASPNSGPPERMSLEHWNRVIGVNLTGAFLMAKHAAPHLRRAQGSIVNIASTRAIQSEPHGEAYAASKGGVLALTHALAMSLGPEVRVNCISPGWIVVDEWKKRSHRRVPALSVADHGQHPAGRAGEPGDIAAMTAFLISDEAGFITGQNFIVDGGMTRKMIYVE